MLYLPSLKMEPEATDGIVKVRPNVWLITSDDVPPLLFTAEEVARFLSVGGQRSSI